MEYVIGIIGLLVGGLIYERVKRKSSEALLENLDSKKEDAKAEAQNEKSKALLEVEQEKREGLQNEEIKPESDLSKLADFFNKPK